MAMRRASIGFGLAILAFGIAIAPPGAINAAAPDAPQGDFHIHYFKERRALTPDANGRLAVFMREEAVDPNRPAPREFIEAERLEPMAIRGWSLVSPAPGGPGGRGAAVDAGAMRERIEVASKDPRVEFVSPVFVDDLGGPLVVTRDLLIGFNPGVRQDQIDEIIALVDAGALVNKDWTGMPGVYRMRSQSRSGMDVLDVANQLAQMDGVAFAEPDMMFTGRGEFFPNDPGFGNCWGIHNTGQFGGVVDRDMDGPEAWDITIGDPSIKVLIIDTGMQQNHPDINQVTGADLTSEGPGDGGPVNSFDNHGTAVGGCVSATINNSLGTVGIAPGCKSASARTFISINSSGNWDSVSSWTVDALAFGESIGARVSNNSNYYGFTSSAIAMKYSTTRSNGMVHFSSAGNNGGTFIGYPASLSTVNAVAALQPNGTLAGFSDSGIGLDFSAPGTSVYSTDRTGSNGYGSGDYVFVQGTSFASPYTAGVAALVFSKNSIQTAAEVETILQNSSFDLGSAGYDTTYGWGFVNAQAALNITPAAGPPGAFSLQTPAAGTTNVVRLPTFAWSHAGNAPTYTLTLDDNSDFSSPILQTMTVLNSYTLTGTPLDVATTYYWKVSAENTLGVTDSTPVSQSFTTLTDPPGSFAMTAPANGMTNVAVTPVLDWDPAPGAEQYLVIVDNNSDLSSPVISFLTTLTLYQPGVALDANTTYYWTIDAVNPIGSTNASTGTWSFMTTVAPPSSFNLLSPADGPNIPISTPTLTWSTAGGADSYTVTVDDDLNFVTPEVSVSGLTSTSYAVPLGTLTSGIRYYWKVRAHNGAGQTASSPSVASFGVLVPPCQGDADGDFNVDFDDVSTVITFWLAQYQDNMGPGDANHDMTVNFIDISSVLSNWGTVCPQ